MSQEFSFKLDFEDFDRSLLGNPPPTIGSDEFKSKITDFFAKQFIGFGGKARVVIDDARQVIEVIWTKDSNWKDPKQKALDLLNAGQIKQALPLLTTLYHKDPSDVDSLYRLGLAYSELGQYQQAIELLEKTVDLHPIMFMPWLDWGLPEIAAGNLLIGEEWLRKSLQIEPKNRWALRNLAGTLMKQQRYDDSLDAIKSCLAVAPDDIAMMIAYGDCLIALGRSEESEIHFRMAVKTGGPDHLVDLAKARLTEKSEKALRSSGDLRPDVVEYMKDALKQFKSMDMAQIQRLALEIAMLGNKGLNINDQPRSIQFKHGPESTADYI